MRVLIADTLLPETVQRLAEAGCEVVERPSLSGDALGDALDEAQAQVLIVRSTKVPADVLSRGQLGLIVRAGAGVNTIDVTAASARGIYVANTPGKNGLAVAELTMGLLIALDRRIPDAVADLRRGAWRKSEYSNARGLAGRRIGVVGAGLIGMAVARRAQALGMSVSVWNRDGRRREEVKAAGFRFQPDLLALAARCDVISLHLAATPETQHIADAAFFGAMRQGAYFINTARSELVDEAALRAAMAARGLKVALDVFDGEASGGSATIDVPLLGEPGLIATPHIGASTDQAQEAVADEVVRIVTTYAETGEVPNVVNVKVRTPASHTLIVRHLNRVGVLSHVFSALKDAQINVEETENIVFDGKRACIARIAVDSAPTPAVLDTVRAGCADVLDLQLVARSTA